jgi:hypothetical protein
MPNQIRETAEIKPKSAVEIIEAGPRGWHAIHTSLVHAARQLARSELDLLKIAWKRLGTPLISASTPSQTTD